MVRKLHAWCCSILTVLWTVGLTTTAISRFQYLHQNQTLYWDFVLPYNQIVHIISSIPFAPIFFLLAFRDCRKNNRRYWPTVLLFILTTVYWLVYMRLYIRWTEFWT